MAQVCLPNFGTFSDIFADMCLDTLGYEPLILRFDMYYTQHNADVLLIFSSTRACLTKTMP